MVSHGRKPPQVVRFAGTAGGASEYGFRRPRLRAITQCDHSIPASRSRTTFPQTGELPQTAREIGDKPHVAKYPSAPRSDRGCKVSGSPRRNNESLVQL